MTTLCGLAVSAGLVAGCTPAQTGGDTTCKDFLAADEGGQNAAITKLLKDEKGTEATNLQITGTRLSVQTFCRTTGTPDSKIKQAPHL